MYERTSDQNEQKRRIKRRIRTVSVTRRRPSDVAPDAESTKPQSKSPSKPQPEYLLMDAANIQARYAAGRHLDGSDDLVETPEPIVPRSENAAELAAINKQQAVSLRDQQIQAWTGVDENLHPWEQQPNESDAEFACFASYLGLGPGRSVRQAAIEHYSTNVANVDRPGPLFGPGKWAMLSARWGWVDRANQWDAWNARQNLEQTRTRMLRDRETRYSRREDAREKLYELIGAMDPNLVELRPGDLFRAVAILNDDARQDLDRIVEKADSAREAKPTDLLSGALTFASLVEMANKAKTSTDLAPAWQKPAAKETNDDAIDAEYRDVG